MEEHIGSIDVGLLEMIRELKAEKKMIDEELSVMSRPLIRDSSKVGDVCKTIIETFGHDPKGDEKKSLVLIVMYLFSPIGLIGYRTENNVRDGIAKALRVKHPSSISRESASALFMYNTYPDFREMTDEVFKKVTQEFGNLMDVD